MNADGRGGMLFVYGGLMRGFDLNDRLDAAMYEGTGATNGRLYAIGAYPGLVDGDGTVRGELYRFDDIAIALEALDELEEYDPLEPERSPYRREHRTVRTDDGRDVLAWVYIYNRDVKGFSLVKSGDWRDRF